MTALPAAQQRYRSPTRCESERVQIEVSLADFSDEELRKECEHRFHGGAIDLDDDDTRAELRRIHQLLLCGQTQRAVDAMREVLRDALGTAL